VQAIVADLEAAGYLTRTRTGRRTRYTVNPDSSFRHPRKKGSGSARSSPCSPPPTTPANPGLRQPWLTTTAPDPAPPAPADLADPACGLV